MKLCVSISPNVRPNYYNIKNGPDSFLRSLLNTHSYFFSYWAIKETLAETEAHQTIDIKTRAVEPRIINDPKEKFK